MGLRALRRRFTESPEEAYAARLRRRFAGVDAVRLADAPARRPVRVCGEVVSLQVVPRAGSSWLEVTVDDGTGRAVAVFSGRTRVPGVDPGRGLVLEGVAAGAAGRLRFLNPTYTLLP